MKNIKYAVQREDGTFVGSGGRGRVGLDSAYLYAERESLDAELKTDKGFKRFYVDPRRNEDLKKWKVVAVQQKRFILDE